MTGLGTETNLENAIEAALLRASDASGIADEPVPFIGPGAAASLAYLRGYRKRTSEQHYDPALCLDPELVVNFVIATQPKEWEKLKAQHGDATKERFLKRVATEIEERGVLDVLRGQVKDVGAKIRLAFFRPSSGINPETQKLYQANTFSFIRQLHYSTTEPNKSLDVMLLLNGLPILTVELKSRLNGQTVEDAIWQYRNDRNPKEPLFGQGRCLAHFAVDNELAYMATKLAGKETFFLPFNQGNAGGAGNPPSAVKHPTAYLWEEVWQPGSILELVEKFCADFNETKEDGRKRRVTLFPRYHQRDCVRRLIGDVSQCGSGKRYLVQHSAGSGKSYTIAWLAHQLSTLHGSDDARVFDSIIIITDRRILDRQLQGTLANIVTTKGVLENIDKTSRQLKEALENGKTIIVTTLQKFPVIFEQVEQLPGRRFAVIVDEAHSSQTGESVRQMRAVLSTSELDKAEQEDAQGEDLDDQIVAEIEKRGLKPNISTFAFTATPKAKTLEIFGTKRPDGSFAPFSLYSMRQAIEERFILDVLDNYTTYATYFHLLKKIEDDPQFDRARAQFLLKQFVGLHPHAIGKKVAIMVEHFAERVRHRIGSKAKAMVVTRSRLHAVRYRLAVDAYLAEKGYPFRALVAFSGEVRDPAGGKTYTEANMNGFPDTQTAETFKKDEYRFLIVAEKFQTGFDQPLLHTMYVDRPLAGVHAVQTLSRLNRTHADKSETMVLDFANEPEVIQTAFADYYDRLILSQPTDPNLLYDRERQLAGFQFYLPEQVARFAKVFWSAESIEKKQPKLRHAVMPAVDRFNAAEEPEKRDFRALLTGYVRMYAFLSQVITFTDADLEKLYWFGKTLLPELKGKVERLPVEVQQSVDMESYRVQETSAGKIELERGQAEVTPVGLEGGPGSEGEADHLSVIIRELNERFGTQFDPNDVVPAVQSLMRKLESNEELKNSIRVSPKDAVQLSFDNFVDDHLHDIIDTNFKLYKQIVDDPKYGRSFKEKLFGWYLSAVGAERFPADRVAGAG